MKQLFNRLKNFYHFSKYRKFPLIINYHYLTNKADLTATNQISHVIESSIFYGHIKWLKENYDILWVDELFEKAANRQSLEGLASITFDDGYSSSLINVDRIINEFQIPCTFFLITASLSNKPLWFDILNYIHTLNLDSELSKYLKKKLPKLYFRNAFHLKKLIKSGQIANSEIIAVSLFNFLDQKNLIPQFKRNFENTYISEGQISEFKNKFINFGSHTHNHYVLSALDHYSQAKEISQSRNIIESLNCQKSKVLALPFGGPNHYNKVTTDLVNKFNYCGILTSSGSNINKYYKSFDSNSRNILNRLMPVNSAYILAD